MAPRAVSRELLLAVAGLLSSQPLSLQRGGGQDKPAPLAPAVSLAQRRVSPAPLRQAKYSIPPRGTRALVGWGAREARSLLSPGSIPKLPGL